MDEIIEAEFYRRRKEKRIDVGSDVKRDLYLVKMGWYMRGNFDSNQEQQELDDKEDRQQERELAGGRG